MSNSSNSDVLVSCVLVLDIMGLLPSSGSGELAGADGDFRLLVQVDDAIALVIDYQCDPGILEGALRLSLPHDNQHLLTRSLQLNFADLDYLAGIDAAGKYLEIRGQSNLIGLDSGDLAIALSELISLSVSLIQNPLEHEPNLSSDFSNGIIRG